MARVTHLWRFAVKGLDRDELPHAQLAPGLGLPSDRRWALLFDDPPEPDLPEAPVRRFDPQQPQWVHKQCFLCAFTAGELLGGLETTFEDHTCTLTVRRRQRRHSPNATPADRATHRKADGSVLLQQRLDTTAGCDAVGRFFSGLPSNARPVQLVQSAAGPHHFGNTPRAFKTAEQPDGDRSGCVIHLVNAATVRALSEAAGCLPLLAPTRFRPNIVIEGVAPWQEFGWVGKRIRVGDAVLEVLARTVRCQATNVDARSGSGVTDHDVPALLRQHFPEHGPFLGIYARVVQAGRVAVGDPVHLDDSGCSIHKLTGLVIVLVALVVALLVRK